jgi:hypothetical protein
VADGKVAAAGSANWSVSGEGKFVISGSAGGPGYKAQNNTQSVITEPGHSGTLHGGADCRAHGGTTPGGSRSDEGVVAQEPARGHCGPGEGEENTGEKRGEELSRFHSASQCKKAAPVARLLL